MRQKIREGEKKSISRVLSIFYELLCVFQPGKCLYTTVRELVENSLDSAESISELPFVEITM